MVEGPRPAASGVALVAVVLLVAAGAGLRAWRLGTPALWFDEIATLYRAEARFGAFLGPVPGPPGPPGPALEVVTERRELHPPLYFLVIRAWCAVAGKSEVALRLPSLLASCAAIVAAAVAAWTLAGPRAAVFASALMAAAPIEVAYAREARGYAFVSFFAATATAALLLLALDRIRKRRALAWAVYVLAIVAGIGVHYAAAVVPLAHAAAWLLVRRVPGVRPLPRALLAAAVLLAPLVVLAAQQLATGLEMLKWLGGPRDRVTRVQSLGRLLPALVIHPVVELPYAYRIAAVGTAVALGLAAVGALRNRPFAAFPAALAVAGPGALVAADLVLGTFSATVPRYAIAASPALWILAGAGAARLRAPLAAVLVLALLGFEASAVIARSGRDSKNGDVRACAAEMERSGCGAGDVVVVVGVPTLQFDLDHHLAPAPRAIVGAKDLLAAPAALDGARRVFLVNDHRRPERSKAVRKLIADRLPERRAVPLDRVTLHVFGEGAP